MSSNKYSLGSSEMKECVCVCVIHMAREDLSE